MAEAVAVVSLVSAIVQLVDFASKVVARLHELRDDVAQAPKAFQDVHNRIPLMLELVKNIKADVDQGNISITSQNTMEPVIRECLVQLYNVNEFIDKATTRVGESAYRRGKKALWSTLRESDLERTDASLRKNFDLLMQAATLQAVGTRRHSSTSSHSTINVMVSSLGGASLSHSTSAPAQNSEVYQDRGLFYPPQGFTYPFRDQVVLKEKPAVFMVPFSRDMKFLGRRELIDDLESRLLAQRQVALAGLGGVGKSQIAIEFSYIFRDRHPESHVFWVYAGTRSRFEQGYQEIARKLELRGWEDPRVDCLQLVCDWLSDEGNGEWLMILDNADDATLMFGDKSNNDSTKQEHLKSLIHYLPKSTKGSLIVTTRDKRVGQRLGREQPIEVNPMSKDDAKTLLLSRTVIVNDKEDNDEDASRLVEELAYLPLAITQASAFISENTLTISEYLELLAMGDTELQDLLSEDLQDPRRDLDTENSVIRTWKLSFDQILKNKPRAADILSLMAVLDYQYTPRILLRDDKETEIGFRTALGALQAFSLISLGTSSNEGFKMHRLVAISTQKWLDLQGRLSYWQNQALRKLAEAFPGRQTYENWALLEALTPHAQLVFSFTFSTAVELLQCAKLLIFSALYDLGKGRYKQAHEKASKSIEIRTKLLPDDHPLTLDSLQTFGECQLHMGELEEAKTTLERAITGREKCLGAYDPDTLESVSDLTITLLEMDEIEMAEKTALRALEGRRKVLGDGHPDTIVSLNIVSMLRQRQGKLEDASSDCEAALKARVSLLGEGHPDTLMTLNNLAVLRYRQGDLQSAETMLKEVLAGEERLLGPDCFDRQVSLTTLALVASERGNLDKAEALHREVLAIRQKVYGPQHPATLHSFRNVAEILEKRGSSDGARVMREMIQRYAIMPESKFDQSPGALFTSGLLFD